MAPRALKNGIPYYLLPSSGTEAASVLVLVKVGSRYETPELSGASHFIEHLMFKGTKKRPRPEHISQALDAVGADYNAFTGKDLTGYWVKVPKSHLGLAIDLLHDMLHASLFRASDMKRETKVILEEINMYHDNPMMHVEELLEAAMFDGSTLGVEIAGTHESMKAMKRADVLRYRDRYYQPSRMVIAVAGALPRDTAPLLRKTFGTLSRPDVQADLFDRCDVRPLRPVRFQYKDTRQVQIAFGFPGVSYEDHQAPVVKVLSTLLGGYMSSRLFSSVREKKGLCYFVRSSHSAYEDTGLFMIQSGLDRARLALAGKTILAEVRKLKRERVGGGELRRAKDYLSGKLTLSFEDSSTRAEFFARQHLFRGKARSAEQVREEIACVTPAQIQAVAHRLFDESRMGLAGIGPFRSKRALQKAVLI